MEEYFASEVTPFCFVTQMFQQVGCTSCLMSGWRTSSNHQEKGECLFFLAVFTTVHFKNDPSSRACHLFSAAITSSACPVCYLLEEWPGSLTGRSQFHPTFSSLVSRQVCFKFTLNIGLSVMILPRLKKKFWFCLKFRVFLKKKNFFLFKFPLLRKRVSGSVRIMSTLLKSEVRRQLCLKIVSN